MEGSDTMANSISARIRVLADRYARITGQHVYSGVDAMRSHYFSDAYIKGDHAALAHMIELCRKAGVDHE
jgi:hypothetical protein